MIEEIIALTEIFRKNQKFPTMDIELLHPDKPFLGLHVTYDNGQYFGEIHHENIRIQTDSPLDLAYPAKLQSADPIQILEISRVPEDHQSTILRILPSWTKEGYQTVIALKSEFGIDNDKSMIFIDDHKRTCSIYLPKAFILSNHEQIQQYCTEHNFQLQQKEL